jgi:hypothetical protein
MALKAFRRLVNDIDEQHHESMRTIETDLAEVHFGESDAAQAASRRRFLQRVATGGAIAFGATLVPIADLVPAALAQEGEGDGAAAGEPTVTGMDLTIVAFAHTVELAAAAAYQAAIDGGKLDDNASQSATLFASHHTDHATALLGLAGTAATNTPNAKILSEFAPRITGAANQPALLSVLRDIEEGAVSTYLFALGELVSPDAAGAAALVLPIEAQHSVALSLLIEPSLDSWMAQSTTYLPTFETDDNAFDPATYAAS